MQFYMLPSQICYIEYTQFVDRMNYLQLQLFRRLHGSSGWFQLRLSCFRFVSHLRTASGPQPLDSAEIILPIYEQVKLRLHVANCSTQLHVLTKARRYHTQPICGVCDTGETIEHQFTYCHPKFSKMIGAFQCIIGHLF